NRASRQLRGFARLFQIRGMYFGKLLRILAADAAALEEADAFFDFVKRKFEAKFGWIEWVFILFESLVHVGSGVEPGFAPGEPFLSQLFQFGKILFTLATEAGFLDAEIGQIAAGGLENVSVDEGGANRFGLIGKFLGILQTP